MNEIDIPYHLAIPTILCAFGLLQIAYNRKRLFADNKLLWRSLTLFLILYILIVGKATLDDLYYQWDLNKYDLDKDGIFSGKEITKGQENAMLKLTNDVGRNFSFITGFLFASFISGFFYILGFIIWRVTKTTHNSQ